MQSPLRCIVKPVFTKETFVRMFGKYMVIEIELALKAGMTMRAPMGVRRLEKC